MAVSGTVANGVIKIALAGYEAVKKQLAQLHTEAQNAGKALGTIGTTSSAAFAAASAGVLGFLKAADPVRFEIFSQKLQILAMYIGLSFIPILVEATAVVDKLIEYFKNLTDEQRENIVHWTKIGLGILAAGSALGTVMVILPKVIALLRALTVVVSLLTSSTGIGLVVALAAVAFAVFELSGGFEKLKPVIEKIQDVFGKFVTSVLGPLMDVLGELAKEAAEQFAALFDAVAPVLTDIGKEVGKMFREVAPIFKALGKEFGKIAAQVGELLGKMIPPLIQLASVFLKLWVVYQATLAKIWLALAEAVVKVFPPFLKILGILTEIVGELTPIFLDLVGILGELAGIIVELAGEVLGELVGILAELIGVLADVFKSFWDAFGTDIIATIKQVANVIKEVLGWIKDLIAGIKEAVSTAKEGYNDIKSVAGGIGDVFKQGADTFGDVLDGLNPFSSSGGGTGLGDILNSVNPFASSVKAEAPVTKSEQVRDNTQPAPVTNAPVQDNTQPDHGQKDQPKLVDMAMAMIPTQSPVEVAEMVPTQTPGETAEMVPSQKPVEPQPSKGWLSRMIDGLKPGPAGTMPGKDYTPLARPVKVENFGIEDAFKKAQAGASFDPMKLAENERKKLLMEQLQVQKDIANNTKKKSDAALAF